MFCWLDGHHEDKVMSMSRSKTWYLLEAWVNFSFVIFLSQRWLRCDELHIEIPPIEQYPSTKDIGRVRQSILDGLRTYDNV